MAPTADPIDRRKLADLRAREDAAFRARIPASRNWLARARNSMPNGVPMAWMVSLFRHTVVATMGEGAGFRDLDGNYYCDFNVCDLAMTMGYGNKAIAAAVATAAERGTHFLMPVEEALAVTEELARRVGLPCWQFTLSASGANTEVMRLARLATGRTKILVFDGQYHGHIDESLVVPGDDGAVPVQLGTSARIARDTVIVPFNDLAAAEAAFKGNEIALVITEPALTNCLLVEAAPGFLGSLHELAHKHGALFCLDEAHTFQFAYGGLTREHGLDSDFVTLGKGLGSGISFALYGMSRAMADAMETYRDCDIGPRGLATGGTTYASTIAIAAAHAALTDVLTPSGYDRIAALGSRLADGLDAAIGRRRLPWRAFRRGPRSGFCLAPDLPRNAAEAAVSMDADFIDARRVYMANRGQWDAVFSAGPQASFAHNAAEIDRYVEIADAFLGEVLR